jgi:CheY-like chemotaxis protein
MDRDDRKLNILIGEDNPDEALLLRSALRELGLKDPVHIVADGEQVIEYLKGVGRYEDRQKYPFPSVLFTDIKMPRMDGFQVLRWIREHPQHAMTPTTVFSSSDSPRDIRLAYELGANAYMVKPSRFEELKDMLGTAYRFWSSCAKPSVSGKAGSEAAVPEPQ